MTASVVLAILLLALAVMVWPTSGPVDQPDGGGSAGWRARPHSRWRPATRPARHITARRADEVADVADLLALALRAGLSPAAAVQLAGQQGGASSLGDLRQALLVDGSQPAVARSRSRGPGRADDVAADLERLLVRAWWLGLDRGAPVAEAMAQVATTMRAMAAARRRERAALAGPAASMWLLTALPVLGPVGALLVGLDPRVLFASVGGVGAVCAGAGLTWLGWWWSRALLHRAARPQVYP